MRVKSIVRDTVNVFNLCVFIKNCIGFMSPSFPEARVLTKPSCYRCRLSYYLTVTTICFMRQNIWNHCMLGIYCIGYIISIMSLLSCYFFASDNVCMIPNIDNYVYGRIFQNLRKAATLIWDRIKTHKLMNSIGSYKSFCKLSFLIDLGQHRWHWAFETQLCFVLNR